MTTCREFQEQVSSYVDGEATAEGRRLIETHVQQCRACARLLEVIRKLSGIIRPSQELRAPQGLWERIASDAQESGAPTPRSR